MIDMICALIQAYRDAYPEYDDETVTALASFAMHQFIYDDTVN